MVIAFEKMRKFKVHMDYEPQFFIVDREQTSLIIPYCGMSGRTVGPIEPSSTLDSWSTVWALPAQQALCLMHTLLRRRRLHKDGLQDP